MPKFLRYVVSVPGALVVWAALICIGVSGLATAILALPFNREYAKRVFEAHDRSAAAVLGWSGEHTVSWECGQQVIVGRACHFCRWTDPIVSFLLQQDDHYRGEA